MRLGSVTPFKVNGENSIVGNGKGLFAINSLVFKAYSMCPPGPRMEAILYREPLRFDFSTRSVTDLSVFHMGR